MSDQNTLPPEGTPPPGGQDKPWFDGMEPDFVGHLQNRGWDKLDPKGAAAEAIKAYRNAEGKLGAPPDELVRFPKLPHDPAWKSIWSKLGTPEKADDYDLASVKFTNGDTLDDALVSAMKPAFHAANLTKAQAGEVGKAIAAYVENVETSGAGETAAEIARQQDELSKEWGINFNKNRMVAQQAAIKLGFDENFVSTLMSQPGAGYAKVMEAFRRIGVAIGEDRFIGGQNGGNEPVTMSQAVDKLNSLKRDTAWVQRFNNGDPAAVREFNTLTETMARGA